jgi:hypothetical protein
LISGHLRKSASKVQVKRAFNLIEDGRVVASRQFIVRLQRVRWDKRFGSHHRELVDDEFLVVHGASG